VDLNAVVRDSLHALAGRLDKAGLRVDARLAPELPPIRGEAVLLEQVFLGLLGNAVEASADDARPITVTTRTERLPSGDVRVCAEVKDHGAGIPEEAMARIFTPFYTTKAQGTGLGLAIAKKFTEAYGGVITVSSRLREGATFRLAFPAAGASSGGAR
jgi:signal transduction histidine kinase